MAEAAKGTDPVGAYIGGFPPETGERLAQVRALILSCAPGAAEKIAYGMPAYVLDGPLVYFAGFANHLGFYPVPTGIEAFREELAPYKQGKGSVQFPHDRPLPLDLIRRIVEFRIAENRARRKA